jgi:hypothetical protein
MEATKTRNKEKEEGYVAREIEDITADLPSDVYLWSALGIMGVSLALKLLEKYDTSLFVGQWAAPILIMGVYNKIVKTQGSD